MPVRITASRYRTETVTEYLYDGDGVRAKKSLTNGETTYYIGRHFEIRGGETVKYIFAGAIRIAMLKGGDTYYFHKDILGSTTAVMTDQEGNLIERIEYLPEDWLVHHRFTDQEWESYQEGYRNTTGCCPNPIHVSIPLHRLWRPDNRK